MQSRMQFSGTAQSVRFGRDSKGVEVSRKGFKWQACEGWIEGTGADQPCEEGSRKKS